VPFASPLRGDATVEGRGADLVGGIKASDAEEVRPVGLIDRMSDNKREERRERRNGGTLSRNGRRVVMMSGFLGSGRGQGPWPRDPHYLYYRVR